jgi:hypothetical protein
MIHARIAIVTAALLMAAGIGFAEEESKETKTMKLRLREAQLELTESEAALSRAATALKEAQTLHDQGLYSKIELAEAEEFYQRAKLQREQAAINLEKTRLAFLNDALYVTLDRAVLYRDQQGQKHALLTLRNSSNIAKIIDEKGTYSDSEKRALLSIENLAVRILKDYNLIGRPFEYKIPRLGYKEIRKVDFVLQRDAEAVTVEIAYGDTLISLPVYLEKEATEDRVLTEAIQCSQEGELGTRSTFE